MSILNRLAGALVDWRGDAQGSANVALYDAAGNRIAKRNRDPVPANAESLLVAGSDGLLSRHLTVDGLGAVQTRQDVLEFVELFQTNNLNLYMWGQLAITQTAGISLGEFILNASAITTVSTGIAYVARRTHLVIKDRALTASSRMQWTGRPNSVTEFGFGAPSSATALSINNGACFRLNANGDLMVVATYNGADLAENVVLTAAQLATAGFGSSYWDFEVTVQDSVATFLITSLTGSVLVDTSINFGSAPQKVSVNNAIQLFARHYNTGVAPAVAGQLRSSGFFVHSRVITQNKPWRDIVAGLGRELGTTVDGNAQTANYTNNAAPTLRTPTNTTAAGEPTLGGQCLWANGANSFAASDTVDLLLFAYTVPAINQLVLTGMTLDTLNLGAANGASAYTLLYFLVIDNAVSLATTPRSIKVLGIQSVAAAAVVGTPFTPTINVNLTTPMVANGGQIVKLGVRVLSGAATASQTIRTIWAPQGYLE